MQRRASLATVFAFFAVSGCPAYAEDIDTLKDQFAFDWRSDPGKTKCAAVDDQLLGLFKSETFSCDLNIVTHTASEEPARVCTEKGEGREYLIFATKKSCETERKTQITNGD